MTIHAVYENGVFRPLEKVDFPDRCELEIEVRQVKAESLPTMQMQAPMSPGLAKIYEILGERYDSGYTDTAERHNEHQP
jgi:predicted DNA-binding antitoxin AbrB/MazE fold protein